MRRKVDCFVSQLCLFPSLSFPIISCILLEQEFRGNVLLCSLLFLLYCCVVFHFSHLHISSHVMYLYHIILSKFEVSFKKIYNETQNEHHNHWKIFTRITGKGLRKEECRGMHIKSYMVKYTIWNVFHEKETLNLALSRKEKKKKFSHKNSYYSVC